MSRLNDKLMAALEQRHEAILKSLIEDAKRLCREAAQTKETKNRTGAQLNSYFWLVCYNGIIKAADWNDDLKYESERGGGHKGLEGTWWNAGNGEDWATIFIEAVGRPLFSLGVKTGRTEGYQIFIIDAAYYSGWLEQGNQNSPINFRRYKVISQIKGECDAVASKYAKRLKTHAKVERLGVGFKAFKPANFTPKSKSE